MFVAKPSGLKTKVEFDWLSFSSESCGQSIFPFHVRHPFLNTSFFFYTGWNVLASPQGCRRWLHLVRCLIAFWLLTRETRVCFLLTSFTLRHTEMDVNRVTLSWLATLYMRFFSLFRDRISRGSPRVIPLKPTHPLSCRLNKWKPWQKFSDPARMQAGSGRISHSLS